MARRYAAPFLFRHPARSPAPVSDRRRRRRRDAATNVQGTANVLDSCRDLPDLRAIVIVTTDKCYENREWSWPYREVDRLGGRDPYSASKACAEMVTAAYRQSYRSEEHTSELQSLRHLVCR